MNILRLFGKGGTAAEILCPHCERAMDAEHDADNCARKRMSRRFFFGVLAGAAAAVGQPEVWTAPFTHTFPNAGLYFSHATFIHKVDIAAVIRQKSFAYGGILGVQSPSGWLVAK